MALNPLVVPILVGVGPLAGAVVGAVAASMLGTLPSMSPGATDARLARTYICEFVDTGGRGMIPEEVTVTLARDGRTVVVVDQILKRLRQAPKVGQVVHNTQGRLEARWQIGGAPGSEFRLERPYFSFMMRKREQTAALAVWMPSTKGSSTVSDAKGECRRPL